jgi:DNA-binding winged helix-turn-helix (wHTH) protein
MTMNIRPKPSARRRNPLPHGVSWSRRETAASADLEFGRFRVLLRRRQLLADGVPVELGTRAFDVLMVLLEADGALVTKEELLSRVWPGVVVAEENVRFQVAALRKALGADRDVIRTEVGRGYRFIGVLRMNGATAVPDCLGRERPRSAPTLPSPASGGGSGRGPHSCRRSFQGVNWAACTERGRFSGLETIGGKPA